MINLLQSPLAGAWLCGHINDAVLWGSPHLEVGKLLVTQASRSLQSKLVLSGK